MYNSTRSARNIVSEGQGTENSHGGVLNTVENSESTQSSIANSSSEGSRSRQNDVIDTVLNVEEIAFDIDELIECLG